MKKLVLAAALAAAASTATAGSLADPIIEAPVIVEDARSSSSGIVLPLILLALAVSPFLARGLNGLALGEATALHVGIRVQRVKTVAILTAAGATGASVAISGGIGFVGIVVPHLLRLIAGPDHRWLLINSGLLGASVLIAADMVSRTVIAPAELPIGIVTAMIGGPFFMWVLLSNRRLLDA